MFKNLIVLTGIATICSISLGINIAFTTIIDNTKAIKAQQLLTKEAQQVQKTQKQIAQRTVINEPLKLTDTETKILCKYWYKEFLKQPAHVELSPLCLPLIKNKAI